MVARSRVAAEPIQGKQCQAICITACISECCAIITKCQCNSIKVCTVFLPCSFFAHYFSFASHPRKCVAKNQSHSNHAARTSKHLTLASCLQCLLLLEYYFQLNLLSFHKYLVEQVHHCTCFHTMD